VLWNPTATAYQSENGIPNDVIFCSLLLLGYRLSLQPRKKMCRKCVATCCSTCVQCERFQQHSRTQVEQQVQQLVAQLVEQHVASVKALLGLL